MSQNSKKERLEARAVSVYRTGVRVHWKGGGRPPRGRGEIKELTPAARARLAFTAQNLEIELTHMVTLTYPAEFPKDGALVKRQFNRLLSWMRSRAKPGKLGYLWFLEFQRRGAPHVHVLLDGVHWTHAELSARWYAAVGSGDERHLRAGTRMERLRTADGAARYVTKYATKTRQKSVPEDYRSVGRFWGASAGARPRVRASYPVDGRGDLLERLAGWEFVGVLEDADYSNLFGAAGSIDVRGLPTIDLESGEVDVEGGSV